MMKIPQLGDIAVKLHFVPFSIKNLAKKLLYSLVEPLSHLEMISQRSS